MARRRAASLEELAAYLESKSAASCAGTVLDGRAVVGPSGRLLAIGILTQLSVSVVYDGTPRQETRAWLHFDAIDPAADRASLLIVRAAREMVEKHSGPVYALCDRERHPTAPRLLELCGFARTSETWGKDEIWLKSN